MTLRAKMILLFSIVMAISLVVLCSYAVQSSWEGADLYTTARFLNMSAGITQAVTEDINMMRLTLNSLTENSTFMSALNQFVRDDTDSRQMAAAARVAATQQLLQSPLAIQFRCVAFINNHGSYFADSSDKECLHLIVEVIPDIIPLADPSGTPLLFSIQDPLSVYGLLQPVFYHGNLLGYLVVLNDSSYLDHLKSFIDEPDTISFQLLYEDGSLFYTSRSEAITISLAQPHGERFHWTDPTAHVDYEVMITDLSTQPLNLIVAQDSAHAELGRYGILVNMVRRALFILIPALVLVAFISFGLTKSIRLLTKKVREVPSGSILLTDPAALEILDHTVTSPADQEIHALELAYNKMMHRLSESAVNELSLREGTLQAQLSALQTQINPHFIYNTLNIISAKSMESGNWDVIEICDQFASMLRYSTDTRSRTATLQEELENVRNYLLLAKARYEDNLEYVIDVPDGLHDIQMPKLTLQPLVENALSHGYNGKNILRKLSILGQRSGPSLILTIRDNGTGFSEEMLENLRQRIRDIDEGKVSIAETGGHIGLINTCLRLHYYSRGSMRISIHNDNGAIICLTLPLSPSEDPEAV